MPTTHRLSFVQRLLPPAMLALAALACALPGVGPTATMAGPPLLPTDTPPPPEPTPTPAPVGNGTVSGALGYPSEGIPPLTLYFQNVDTSDVLTLSTDQDESSYTKTLPPGTYHVYAWLTAGGL